MNRDLFGEEKVAVKVAGLADPVGAFLKAEFQASAVDSIASCYRVAVFLCVELASPSS